MHFFSKTASSSSSSSPSSPSVSTIDNNSTGNSINTKKKLTRQKKLRHVHPQVLGLNLIGCLNSLPDSARKDRRPLSAVPQPLPLPELPLTKKRESSGSNLHPGSPEEGSNSRSTNNIEHDARKSAKSSSNFRGRCFQHANAGRTNYDLRLSIPVRSAPTSGFSSPAVSPQRSNTEVFYFSCITSDTAKYSTGCHRGLSPDINVDSVSYNSRWIASPRSAPTSGFPSPAVSPQRSNTGDFLPSFVAPREFHVQSALEVPDLGKLAGHNSRVLPVNIVHSPDHSPLYSPTLQSPQLHPKNTNKFSFPLHHKLPLGSSKVLPEGTGHVNAHPLPLPPGVTPSQLCMPSTPAAGHCTTERPNVSPMKTQWLKGKLIGRGSFGSVYLGRNQVTGASCAIKEVDIIPDDPKSANCIKQLEQEIKILRCLKHPNIVQYYGSEIVDDHFYIYLEYVHPGSINKYVHEHDGQITESIVRNFTRHILSGLAYLHSTKTIHRDIKGANLLVNVEGVVKLADFGMAKHLTGLSYELSLNGSPHWMAPEVVKAVIQKDANPDLALAVDIWSLGCTIIEMFTGKPPWGELHGAQAMFKALYRAPPIPETLSPEGKDFLCCCFQRNPAQRPSAITLLEHPFVCNSNDLNVSACTQSLSAMNLVDKSLSPRDHAAHETVVMPTSPVTQSANGKLPSDSETGQQSGAQTFNCATASHHSRCSVLEVPSCISTTQEVHGSHNFRSSNVSSNVLFGAVSNHPLAVLRSHEREVPQI